MRDFVPSMIVVRGAGVTDSVLGPLASLEATWTSASGERFDVCVQLLSRSALRSLVPLLCRGEIGPLSLLALATPVQ